MRGSGADIVTSTLSKALGGASGGFVAGSRELVELLRRASRSYIFTTSLPASIVATALKTLELLQNDRTILSRLRRNTSTFRRGLELLGFDVKGNEHPICPVMIRDDLATWRVADFLNRQRLMMLIKIQDVEMDVKLYCSQEWCLDSLDYLPSGPSGRAEDPGDRQC